MSHIPGLKEELMRPRAVRADRYNFSTLKSYFQGAGSKIVSKSCKIVCADECDQWPAEHPQNLRDLLKRTRSYNASMAFIVCSPTTQQGQVWQNFLKGSQGYWTLRCKGCGELTMRSCDIHNLQFTSTYHEELKTYIVNKGSERLVCPKCGYEHIEDDKKWMNVNGAYVHLIPELQKEKPSYQIGALASQLPALSWSEIATAQLEAGKTSDISIQQNFDNSWRGLCYKPRAITKDEITKLKDNHIWHTPPSLENVEIIFGTADVMDSFISYAVFAWDVNDSLYMLEDGKLEYLEIDEAKRKQINAELQAEGKPPVKALDDYINKEFLVKDDIGIKPTFWFIDVGGHRSEEVKHFTKIHKNVMMQKGTSMTSMNWRLSENQSNLVLTNEKYWKSTTIYYLYAQKNREENYLWFNPSISEESLAEIRDLKPDETSKFGHDPQNWVSKTGVDHCFDLLKYAYCAKDFALQSLLKTRYRFAKAPSILRRFEKVKKAEEEKQQNDAKKNSWFNI